MPDTSEVAMRDVESRGPTLDALSEGVVKAYFAKLFPPTVVAYRKSNQAARCGAKTRKGLLCRAKVIPEKARCRFHGGMSTGPKTPEGRERIAEAQRLRWAKWRAINLGQ